MIPKNMI